MHKWRTWLILILAAGAAGILLYQSADHGGKTMAASQAAVPSTATSTSLPIAPEIGAYAPEIQLGGMDGRDYSLTRFRGKPVVLNFWASWCGPCKEEAPIFTKLYDAHHNELQVIAVNLTSADSEADARKFVKTHGFQFPVLLDFKGNAATAYRIRPIPSTFFIDSQGVIVDGVLGALTEEDLNSRVSDLIKSGS